MDVPLMVWREIGARSSMFRTDIQQRRVRSLVLSETKTLESPLSGPVTALRIDGVQHRYVLAATQNSSVSILDFGDEAPVDNPYYMPKIASMNNRHPSAHRFGITDAAWYPHDTGLFVTASVDQLVKVWDTNTMEMAVQFDLQGEVRCVSLCPGSMALIAAAESGGSIRLCDLSSGSFTHALTAHEGAVNAVEWLPGSDYMLLSGGFDGFVHLWDVVRHVVWSVVWREWKSHSTWNHSFLQRSGAVPLHTLDQEDGNGVVAMRVEGGVDGGRGGAGGASASDSALAQAGRMQGQVQAVIGTGRAAKASDVDALSQAIRLQASHVSRSRWALGFGMPTGADIAASHAHSGQPIFGLRFSMDGRYLVTAGGDSSIRLWSAASMRHTFTHFARVPMQMPTRLALSGPGSTPVLFVPTGNDIYRFNALSGASQGRLRGHFGRVGPLAFNPRTCELASGADDGEVLVWSPDSEADTGADDGSEYEGSVDSVEL